MPLERISGELRFYQIVAAWTGNTRRKNRHSLSWNSFRSVLSRFCGPALPRKNRFAIRPEERIVTTVSRLLPWKHTEVVLESIAILTRRKVPVRLFVAVDGVMRAQWEKLSKELSIADRVHWLGHLKDTSCLLRASDIFTLASEGEAFGFVLGEAMACGIPVVGSRSGSMPELIIDGKTGFSCGPAKCDCLQ